MPHERMSLLLGSDGRSPSENPKHGNAPLRRLWSGRQPQQERICCFLPGRNSFSYAARQSLRAPSRDTKKERCATEDNTNSRTKGTPSFSPYFHVGMAGVSVSSSSVIAGIGAFFLGWLLTELVTSEHASKQSKPSPAEAAVRARRAKDRPPPPPLTPRSTGDPIRPTPPVREIQLPPLSDLESEILDASGARRHTLMVLRGSLGSAVSKATFGAKKACLGGNGLPPTVVRVESSAYVDANLAEIRQIADLHVDRGAPVPQPLADCLLTQMRRLLPISIERKRIPAHATFEGNTSFPVSLKNAVQCSADSADTCGP